MALLKEAIEGETMEARRAAHSFVPLHLLTDSNEFKPLHGTGHEEIARVLLEAAATRVGVEGCPWINTVAATMIQDAARCGGDAGAKLRDGWTPPLEAAFYGHEETVSVLLDVAAKEKRQGLLAQVETAQESVSGENLLITRPA